ncbi:MULTISPECIES: LacI family DNA-binding transcriptional regulator [Saccharothrix]|uniref:LacI family transcriptional regulator n=1 Tax=Saccharothrix yanglingensis TaxID=659496 RepID=A0ABU0X885_9PSEU|nr:MULTISPECIES: LacI family DNA-binding transcriptional regulator [Saccharothrix]MDQ2588252.1 LacI family transcriptional regulator [Saccharothrix yanglingensis]MDU0293499.1 LacI family DNA-binding transcriptional regulator [Saccharothrix longispora]
MSASTESSPNGAADGAGKPVAASISSIAAEAGVSVPTVSKVLNGRPDVAADTRARVESVIERHRYRRRRARQSSRPALIDLVFHEMNSAWATEIIRGVEQAAAVERAAVVLSELGGAHRPRREWFDDLLTRRPLGVILVLAELDAEQRHQLATRTIPFVVVDTAGEQPPGVPTVGSANWAGGLAATRHLIALGHRRIAVVSGPTTMLCSRARVDGYRSALEAADVPIDPELVRYGDFYVHGGYHHGLVLLDRPDRPTAIFAGSDFQALGVMRAARELGLSVPRDLSIVGYDDLSVTEWIGPPLTTVRQPLREMATTAAQMVFTLARGERPPNERIDLATELVVRESTAPPVRP